MERMLLALAVAALPALAAAQEADGFPPGAKPMTPEAITQAVSGKSFPATNAAGKPYSIEYHADGTVLNNARGYGDHGKWHAEGSTLCFEWQKQQNGCGEMRELDGAVYYKRYTDGRVGKMKPE